MATQKLPLVFMQNSGFGNVINTLTSLHQIYNIPAIMLVTWRAEEGYGTDAPEHWIVGANMEKYFATYDLPYRVITTESWREDLRAMKQEALKRKKPTVLCVRKGLFADYAAKQRPGAQFSMTGKEALDIVKKELPEAVFLSTTGMISRESFTVKDTPDFYMMGSMGLISGIAAGCAQYTDQLVVALDGDGALMMHMGLLPFIGHRKYKNFLHVVLDNEAYASTLGQPTVSPTTDFVAAALACGYERGERAITANELSSAIAKLKGKSGPALLHIKVRSDTSHGVGRVSDKYSCPDVTERFGKNFPPDR